MNFEMIALPPSAAEVANRRPGTRPGSEVVCVEGPPLVYIFAHLGVYKIVRPALQGLYIVTPLIPR